MPVEGVTLLLLSLLLLLQLLLLHRSRIEARERREMETQLQQTLRTEVRGLFNQLESYHYLRDRLDLRQGMPYTRDWSASPDFLKLIVEHCLEHQPATILECSSGLTTVMLARCCQLNGHGHVFSLENGAEYAARSRGQLQRYGLETATVIDAPLRDMPVGATQFRWYGYDGLPEGEIEMLVIDGPPGFIQRHSRYPALPLLYDRLADGCVIFLDDAARRDEQEIVQLWQQQYPGLSHRYIHTERGCSVLTLSR